MIVTCKGNPTKKQEKVAEVGRPPKVIAPITVFLIQATHTATDLKELALNDISGFLSSQSYMTVL